MKEIVKLEAYNIEQLVNLSGVKDENLEVLLREYVVYAHRRQRDFL